MSEIDEYLKKFATPSQKGQFQKIQKMVMKLAPNALESISYGVPTFKVNGKPLLYFASYKDHMSLHPASDEMIEEIPELAKFRTGKGTLQFTEQNLIPDSVVVKVVEFQLKKATAV